MHSQLLRDSSGSSSTSAPPLISAVRPRRRRIWLALLLTALALAGLLANLILLYASIDHFMALLRHQCSADAGQERMKAEESTLPRVRIGTTEMRHFSAKMSQKSTEHVGTQSTHSTEVPSTIRKIPLHRTTLFVGKQSPPSRTSALPRFRLTADDLALANAKMETIMLSTKKAVPSTSTRPTPRITTVNADTSRSNVTVVTALLDIGRDRWSQYGRTMQQYHRFMRHLLQLRVPMVVLVDQKSLEFVHRERARIGWGAQTKIRQISFSQLPLFAFQSQVGRIMRSELANWQSDWDPAMRSHPEANHPEYVTLVNSKPFFLAEAAAENPFGTEFFVWLDAGYGHGERSVFPAQWQWRPQFKPGKISVIKLTPTSDPAQRYGLKELYRQDVSVFSGGFIAGDQEAVARLHRLHYHKFAHLVERERKVDDDQTLLVLLANENPELFHISHGDWFDAFELF